MIKQFYLIHSWDLIGTTILNQRGSECNSNSWLLLIPQRSWTRASRWFSVTDRTLVRVRVLPLCRDAIGVFYSSSQVGSYVCVCVWYRERGVRRSVCSCVIVCIYVCACWWVCYFCCDYWDNAVYIMVTGHHWHRIYQYIMPRNIILYYDDIIELFQNHITIFTLIILCFNKYNNTLA